MDWAMFAAIVAKENLPVAIAVFRKWASGNPPTDSDMNELSDMSKQFSVDRAKAKLLAKGIPLDSDKAKEILELVGS